MYFLSIMLQKEKKKKLRKREKGLQQIRKLCSQTRTYWRPFPCHWIRTVSSTTWRNPYYLRPTPIYIKYKPARKYKSRNHSKTLKQATTSPKYPKEQAEVRCLGKTLPQRVPEERKRLSIVINHLVENKIKHQHAKEMILKLTKTEGFVDQHHMSLSCKEILLTIRPLLDLLLTGLQALLTFPSNQFNF